MKPFVNNIFKDRESEARNQIIISIFTCRTFIETFVCKISTAFFNHRLIILILCSLFFDLCLFLNRFIILVLRIRATRVWTFLFFGIFGNNWSFFRFFSVVLILRIRAIRIWIFLFFGTFGNNWSFLFRFFSVFFFFIITVWAWNDISNLYLNLKNYFKRI